MLHVNVHLHTCYMLKLFDQELLWISYIYQLIPVLDKTYSTYLPMLLLLLLLGYYYYCYNICDRQEILVLKIGPPEVTEQQSNMLLFVHYWS